MCSSLRLDWHAIARAATPVLSTCKKRTSGNRRAASQERWKLQCKRAQQLRAGAKAAAAVCLCPLRVCLCRDCCMLQCVCLFVSAECGSGSGCAATGDEEGDGGG